MRKLIFSILGSILGLAVGLFLFRNFIPPWKHYDIRPLPEKASNILLVKYHLSLDDPTNDILYVKSQSGNVYSISILQGTWQMLPPLPAGSVNKLRLKNEFNDSPLIAASEQGKFYQLSSGPWESLPDLKEPWGWNREPNLCATAWDEHPHLIQKVTNSTGVSYERPLSTIIRCYVLFDNGSLQVWTRWTDVFGLMLITATSAIIGLLIGIMGSSAFFARFEKRKIIGAAT